MEILPSSASPTNALMSRVEKNLPESRDSISRQAGKELGLRTACVALPVLAVISAVYHAMAATLKTALLLVTVPLRAFDVKVSDSLKGDEILKHMRNAFSAAICAVVAIPMILHSSAAVVAAHKALLPSESAPKSGPIIEVIEDEPSVRVKVATAVVKKSGISGPSAGALIKTLYSPAPLFDTDSSSNDNAIPEAPPMDSGIPEAPPMGSGIPEAPSMDEGIPQAPPMAPPLGSGTPRPSPALKKVAGAPQGDAQEALLAAIRGGAKLKKAAPKTSEGGEGETVTKDPVNALMDAIKKGPKLKRVSEEDKAAIAKKKAEEAEKAAKADPRAALNEAIAKKAAAKKAAGAPALDIDQLLAKRKEAVAAEPKPATGGSMMDAMRARLAQLRNKDEE